MNVDAFDPAPRPSPTVAARLIDHLRNGTTDQTAAVRVADPTVFTASERAADERAQVFGRAPVIVAHSSELAESYSFLRRRLPNNEVVVTRQPDGSLRAFLNVCRHRGSLVVRPDRGSARVFTCPYHGWSYDGDGALRNITYAATFGNVDASCSGLLPVPVTERYGLIWLVDNPSTTLDLDDWLGPELSAILSELHLEEQVCTHSGSFDEPVNWKIMQDAFLDGYHLRFVHPQSAGPHFHTNVMVAQDFGRHVRFFAPRTSIDRYVADGPGDAPLDSHVTITHYIAPNVTMLRQPDHTQILSFFPHPSDPGRCRMEMRLIVPPQATTGLDPATWQKRWDKNWDILMAVLRDEDFPLLREIQVALSSGHAGPLVYGRNEVINQAFHRTLDDLLGA